MAPQFLGQIFEGEPPSHSPYVSHQSSSMNDNGQQSADGVHDLHPGSHLPVQEHDSGGVQRRKCQQLLHHCCQPSAGAGASRPALRHAPGNHYQAFLCSVYAEFCGHVDVPEMACGWLCEGVGWKGSYGSAADTKLRPF